MKNLLETLFAGAPLVSLLRIFLLNPQTSFYQRELERLTGEHLYQIQRELGRLEAIGLGFPHGKRQPQILPAGLPLPGLP